MYDCSFNLEMEMRVNHCRKPGQPKSHSKKALPLNRQLQALNGTYKSREKEEHDKKIKIGQKNLLQRMKSDDSEFSVASCDGIATSKVERLKKYQQKFEQKALEGYNPPENTMDKIGNYLGKLSFEIKTEYVSDNDGENDDVFLNQDNEGTDADLDGEDLFDDRELKDLVDDPELQKLQNQLFGIFIVDTESDIKEAEKKSENTVLKI